MSIILPLTMKSRYGIGFYSAVSNRKQRTGELAGMPVSWTWREKAERRLHQC